MIRRLLRLWPLVWRSTLVECDESFGRSIEAFIELRKDRDAWIDRYDELAKESQSLSLKVVKMRIQINGHIDRIAAQAALLSKRAEK